jgi:endonuclease/exonuclease/phosphatase (EEP) superfamily protein YafD
MVFSQISFVKTSLALLLSSLVASSITYAQHSCRGLLLPSTGDLISSRSELLADVISNPKIRFLTWNIQKAQQKDRLGSDLRLLGNESDIMVLQEAVNATYFVDQLEQFRDALDWSLSISFQRRSGDFTGVMTGSKTHAAREEVLVSSVTEPVSNTPKTILLSEYAIENSRETLLVANVHAINFVTQKSFETQMNQLILKLASHQGPLIVAGDFNTWNPYRMAYLQNGLRNLGLQPLDFDRKSFLKLDHVFVRGLRAGSVTQREDIKSSDHFPIEAELFFEH